MGVREVRSTTFGGMGMVWMLVVHGSLDIRKLAIFNRTLLGKWLLALWSGGNTCMKACIAFKYGVEWDKILHYTHLDVGIGSLIWCWHNHWRGDQPLRMSHLLLYNFQQIKTS